jgi:hypothetical protein
MVNQKCMLPACVIIAVVMRITTCPAQASVCAERGESDVHANVIIAAMRFTIQRVFAARADARVVVDLIVALLHRSDRVHCVTRENSRLTKN